MKTVLFKNGVFHSNVDESDVFSYLAVRRGRIVGTYKTCPCGKFDEVVDLKGQHVYPCLIDGHVHVMFSAVVMATGFNVCEINADGVSPNTFGGIEARIRDYCAKQGSHDIVVMNNFVMSAMDEKRLPTATELDDWSSGRACVVYNIDGHSMALSTAMMQFVGILSENGIFTGEENEKNQGHVIDAISSKINAKILAKGVAQFQNRCAEYGISVVAALEGNADSPKDLVTSLLVTLARRFSIGVRLFPQYTDLKRAQKFRKYMSKPRIGGCGQWEMDGSVGSHSAAFSVPFKDTGEKAPCYFDQDQVDGFVSEAFKAGYQVGSHAIGDLAIERLMKAYDKSYDPSSKVLHIIEHCEFPNQETFEQLKRGRYALMMQPGYAWIDKRFLHSYEQTLPQTVLDEMKMKSFYDAGICLCGSSDSPVQDLDPYLQMQGMTQFYNPKESLTPYEALRCYTANAAKALMEEDERGTLEVGKVADFFTLSEDFFKAPADSISKIRPNQTYIGGKLWKRKKGDLWALVGMMLKRAKKI